MHMNHHVFHCKCTKAQPVGTIFLCRCICMYILKRCTTCKHGPCFFGLATTHTPRNHHNECHISPNLAVDDVASSHSIQAPANVHPHAAGKSPKWHWFSHPSTVKASQASQWRAAERLEWWGSGHQPKIDLSPITYGGKKGWMALMHMKLNKWQCHFIDWMAGSLIMCGASSTNWLLFEVGCCNKTIYSCAPGMVQELLQ